MPRTLYGCVSVRTEDMVLVLGAWWWDDGVAVSFVRRLVSFIGGHEASHVGVAA